MSKTKTKKAAAPAPTATTLPRAAQLLESGHLTQAEAACRAMLETKPDDADVIHLLGLTLAKRGERAAAEAELERALAIRPTYSACRQNLGLMLMESEPERAEQCFRRVTEEVPNATLSFANLAVLQEKRGDLKGAEASLRSLLRFAPLDEDALRSLAHLQRRLGQHEAEVETGYVLLRLRPNDPKLRAAVSKAYFFYFDAIWRQELRTNRNKVIRVLEDWLAVDPAHPTAKHMHAALTGKGVPKRASNEYLTRYFDEFAPEFDQNLATLGYDAPARMKDALAKLCPTPNADLAILDMGCGTGALGPLIAPWKKKMVAVDLSPKMIDHARARGVYDELHVGELTAFVSTKKAAFDVAMCLDTLIYIGELDDVFRATHAAMKPGGLFFGTTEERTDDTDPGFSLHDGGRYSHSQKYMRDMLEKNGFEVIELSRQPLRKERGEPVPGLFFTARRKD